MKVTMRLSLSAGLVCFAPVALGQLSIPDGIWTSRGYGFALSVVNGTISVFEETSISCIENPELIDELVAAEVNKDNVLEVATSGLELTLFDKAPNFLYGCLNGTTPTVGDDEYVPDTLFVFDVLATTFAEHYAFFEQRNISWNEVTSSARSTLTSASSDDELFDAFVSMLDMLNDGHVQIIIPDQEFYSSKPLEVITRLIEEFSMQDEFDDFETFQNTMLGTWIEILAGYMDENILEGDIDTFLYGTLANATVGYMMFQGFSTDDEQSYGDQLEAAFKSLQSTESMIVDIRVNSGGDDATALRVASYFAESVTPAFSKKAWNRNSETGFTTTTEVTLEPTTSAHAYSGNVVLIVSGSTVSAAEIFTLAMAQLPQVTILGRPTSGEFSDILGRTLPNKWLFGLSNEVYSDPDGAVFEIIGIPPDIEPEEELLTLDELQTGSDSWLEVALEVAEDNASEEISGSSSYSLAIAALTWVAFASVVVL